MGSRPNSLLIYGIYIEEGGEDYEFLFKSDEEDEYLDEYDVAGKLGKLGHVTNNYDESELRIGVEVAKGDWDFDEVISLDSVGKDFLAFQYENLLNMQTPEIQKALRKHKPKLRMISYYQ